MGKPTIGELEMGRKPVVPWDEPRTAADIRDLEAGFGGMFDEKEGRVAHASPDLSRDLPAEFVEGRTGMHSRQSSWVQRGGDASEASALQMATVHTAEDSNHVPWSGTR
jgi:palmitoyltransferase ZDHHC9/14/18